MISMQFLATDYGSQIMKKTDCLFILIPVICIMTVLIPTNLCLILLFRKKIEQKKRIKEKLYYGGTFEQYLSEFLPAFDADTDAK